MNWAAPLLLLALLAAAPAPLVVGSVRDKGGVPVGDAHVQLLAGGQVVATATTGGDGTFSTPGAGDRLRVECAYCRTQEFAVPADGVVVVIIQRYDAIRSVIPTGDDLAHLPYARVESDLSLTPFVILNQSASAVPGAWLNDRNALPQTGLVVLNGVPDYDITADISPFDTMPQYGAGSVGVSRVDDAYEYGDLANAGTFDVNTTGGSSAAYGGDDFGVRAATAPVLGDVAAAWSDWDEGDRRSSVALAVPIQDNDVRGSVAITTGDGDLTPALGASLDSAFSSARVSLETTGSIDAFATALTDRGSYNYESSAPAGAIWSDSEISFGVRSHTTVAPFALFDARTSAGALAMPGSNAIAANLGQARSIAGIDYSQSGYHAEVTFGDDDFTYAGGYPGAVVNNGSSPSASASIDLNFDPQWTLHASDNHGYTLQTFLSAYGPQAPDAVTPNDAITTSEASLDFDSLQRFRASLTALRSQDAEGVQTSSAGGSLAWQICPQLSVRSWLLQEQSTTASPQIVGSAWLTYRTPGLRIDAILRRDLLDGVGDTHVDGSISGPLGNRLSWFVTSERRVRMQSTDAGIRF